MSPDHLAEAVLIDISQGQRAAIEQARWKPRKTVMDHMTKALRVAVEMEKPIHTSHIYPPIPIRDYDWVAYFDGEEEGPHGWGKTEAEAKQDLLDNYGDEND